MKLGEVGLTIIGLSKFGHFTMLWVDLGISLASDDFSTVKNFTTVQHNEVEWSGFHELFFTEENRSDFVTIEC
jgi:hypothetical protein